MSWYDLFSNFYDASVESLYAPYRSEVVSALNLSSGDQVLDLACGTGPNFEHLFKAVGEQGAIVGLDASSGMIARATKRAEDEGFASVRTLQADAATLVPQELTALMGRELKLKGVVVCLGISVIDDWQAVLDSVYNLLEPGGRLAIFDVHTQKWVPMTPLVRLTAQADMSRRPWEHLETLGAKVTHRYLEGSAHVYGGTPYLAVAQKVN